MARIEQVNPKLNAVIHKMYDQARATAAAGPAQGRFSGVPFLLKDLVAEYKDAPFEEGSRSVQGYVSRQDSELVRRLKSAGLIIIGKTNTPEFGLVPTTEPELYGPTLNPWAPHLTPGGSSGGSAAAVGRPDSAHGPRQRRWRLHPVPGFLLRYLRTETDPGTQSLGAAFWRYCRGSGPRTRAHPHSQGFGRSSGCDFRSGHWRPVPRRRRTSAPFWKKQIWNPGA